MPADEKIKLVQKHFDEVAARYDFVNTFMSFGSQGRWKRQAVADMRLAPGDRVLDVCGGTADLALLAMKDVGPDGRVVLFDINEAMMTMGRRKVRKAGLVERVPFVQGNAEELSFADNSFDAAMAGFGVRNLTRVQRGLEEMHRVLKPGGTFMCLEFSRPGPAWFRLLYELYSFLVMPVIGRIFYHSWDACRYLPQSIRLWPSPDAFSDSLREIGFKNVSYRLMTHGVSVIHIAEKG